MNLNDAVSVSFAAAAADDDDGDAYANMSQLSF